MLASYSVDDAIDSILIGTLKKERFLKVAQVQEQSESIRASSEEISGGGTLAVLSVS